MPPVVVAIASYAAGAWAAGAAVAAGWGVFAVAAVRFGAAFVVNAIGSRILGTRPDVPSSERRETIRSAAANRRVGFGVVRTGGIAVHALSTGDENKFMHMIIVLQHGEVDHIDSLFYLNDKRSDDPVFAGKVYAEYYLGTENQAACASAMAADPAGWTAAHRLQGIAYVYLRLEFDQTAFPNGLPTASFIVKASKVFDPRLPAGTPAAWSNNSALCLLAYLRAPWGMNAPDDLIDMESFAAAANICDEVVGSIDPALAGLRRYTCNGMIDLGAAPASIIESMQSSCAGHLTFSNGKYRLYVGAYTAPVGVITASQLRGEPVVRMAPSRSALFNTVRGSYVEPRQDWQEVDYAEQVDEDGLAEDGSEIVQAVSFPFTTNGATCQRLAKLSLARARGGVSIKLPLNWTGMQYQLYDVVELDLPGPDAMQSRYRIVEYTLADGGGVDVTLQAEEPEYYDWTPAIDEELVPVLAPAASTVNPAIVISTAETYPIIQTPRPTLTIGWHMSVYTSAQTMALINAGTIGGFHVQWRKSTAVTYALVKDQAFVKTLDSLSKFTFSTPDISPNTQYYVRVRTYYQGGGAGPWVEVLCKPGMVATDGVLLNLTQQTLNRTVPAQFMYGSTQTTTTGGKIALQFRSDGTLELAVSPIYTTTSGTRVVETSTTEVLPAQWNALGNALTSTTSSKFSVRASLNGSIKGTYATTGYQNANMAFNVATNQTGWFSLGSPYVLFAVDFDKVKDQSASLPLFIEIRDNASGIVLTSAYINLQLSIAS